jgi:hypothetical protein
MRPPWSGSRDCIIPAHDPAHLRLPSTRHLGGSDSTPATRGYSPPPPAVSPIKGLIDFHTRAAPDVMGRAVNDDELALLAASREMEAVVFKNPSP